MPCSISIPQSGLEQSKARLIRWDRHVGQVIWIVQLSSGTAKAVKEQLELLGLSSGTAKAVKEQLELLGVTGKPSKTIKTDRRLIGGYYCMGSRRSERQRQAVEELNGGLGASVGGSERTLERGCVLDAMAYAIAHGNASMCLDAMVMLSDRAANGSKERCTDVHDSRERVTGTRWFESRMAVRCTDGIEGCRAEYVLTGQGVITDWFWNASKAGVLSVLDGWLETKPSLFVHGHVGMVG
ncbi:hypothetical protein DY000_02044988 [Brassica cretica]|uniref:Uncharacterized protein n=1 Tax=Brassica cretica TaxID=69181 RepID=A0ABQ7F236_BRACR|nr:hypothetical protein DY000_02044988 [Brassica cretica]